MVWLGCVQDWHISCGSNWMSSIDQSLRSANYLKRVVRYVLCFLRGNKGWNSKPKMCRLVLTSHVFEDSCRLSWVKNLIRSIFILSSGNRTKWHYLFAFKKWRLHVVVNRDGHVPVFRPDVKSTRHVGYLPSHGEIITSSTSAKRSMGQYKGQSGPPHTARWLW